MDAFAVSIAAGFARRNVLVRQAFLLACTFWWFQALMPLIGWLWWQSIRDIIEPIDHWVAFFLLSILGANMIRESLSHETDSEEKRDYFGWKSLWVLGIATSIDALIIGISLALLPVDIWNMIWLIGGVTFVFCFAWVYIGARFGHIFEKKAEIVGWLILIGMGIKILLEHLFC